MNDLLAGLNGGNVPALELIFMLTLVALLPSIVVMMTSFTRTIIIISFTRSIRKSTKLFRRIRTPSVKSRSHTPR